MKAASVAGDLRQAQFRFVKRSNAVKAALPVNPASHTEKLKGTLDHPPEGFVERVRPAGLEMEGHEPLSSDAPETDRKQGKGEATPDGTAPKPG